MSGMSTSQRMIDWLSEELERRNLSQSRASLRAGLGSSTISEIMAGRQPGLKACIALAKFFGVPLTRVLYLAGHISEEEAESRDAYSEQVLALLDKMTTEQKRAFAEWLRSVVDMD